MTQPADAPEYLPAASLDVLRARAAVMEAVRAFFREAGYLEVQTPVLSRDVVVDAWLEPFVTRWSPEAGGAERELFLQTSPEAHMKRLLAAGAEAIWQATPVFRQGEHGRLHEPQFTMIEWYRAGDDHHAQMAETERLVRAVCASGLAEQPALPLQPRPFDRTRYEEAFERHAGTAVLDRTADELASLARARAVDVPESLDPKDRDGWLNLLLGTLVEPHLGRGQAEFLYEYPASQAALARVSEADPRVAERFELYVDGVELANGYHELTDADELRRRIRAHARTRRRDGRRELPAESRLLEAMDAGLPRCAGVALGFDRLAALVLGKATVREVMAFPFDRA